MVRKTTHWVFALLGLLASLGCFAIWLLSWESEEYAVYVAIVRAAYDGPDISHHVILDTTEPWGRWGVTPFHSKVLGLPIDVRASYTVKNFLRFHLPSTMRLGNPYTLASENELKASYNEQTSKTLRATEPTKLIRGNWGVITFSRVGFDLHRKHAVVYAQLIFCGLCGGGDYFYLSKE
ncbi:MAG TPA: hypothetical protein VFN26_00010 [Candidatus Acidoferrum sp.]|nr:hypothetical protein [Candidatus Acidoferrum sp.]